MIELIFGKKGSGKTKVLVEKIKEAAAKTTGNVVCIEKSMQLTTEIPYSVRLVDVDGYGIDSYDKFYGFVAGTVASNYDIKEIFVDGILKIGGRNYDELAKMLTAVDAISKDITVVFTISEDEAVLPEAVLSFKK